MNTEAIKVLEERVNVLSSKKERLLSLTAQLKAESYSTLDTMNREVESIAYSISELKSAIEDLKKQDSANPLERPLVVEENLEKENNETKKSGSID